MTPHGEHMAGQDAAGETRIGRDWVKSLALAAICIFLVAVSAYGVGIEPEGRIDRRFRSGSFVMLPIFALVTPLVLVRLVLPWGAPVRFGPAGFADLRAGPDTIPWEEISNVVRRGDYVTLTLRRRYAKTYRWSPTQRALKAMRKSAGPTHLLVAEWCLATTATDLLEAIVAARARYATPEPEPRSGQDPGRG